MTPWGKRKSSAYLGAMSFDLETAESVRRVLRDRADVVEKQMFGGIGFLLAGNMCVGVWKEYLIVRVGQDAYAESLDRPGVKEFDITGRAMRGWVMVAPEGFDEAEQLRRWVEIAVRFVEMLPAK